MKSFVALLKNEMKLNIRNMNMVIFAVIMPLIVLVIQIGRASCRERVCQYV